MLLGKTRDRQNNIWPGFVDALSTLLLVIIFLLILFAIVQFYLKETIISQDQALDDLSSEITLLTEKLGLSEQNKKTLEDQIRTLNQDLSSTENKLDEKTTEASDLLNKLSILEKIRSDLEKQLVITDQERSDLLKALTMEQEQKASVSSQLSKLQDEHEKSETKNIRQIKLLNQQIFLLREHLKNIAKALNVVKPDDKTAPDMKQLTEKINVALAEKVEQLSKYRSEFFGKLRDVLGENRKDIRIEGDRFVLQSEVLFASGSSEIGKEGQNKLKELAKILNDIAKKIPNDIKWILRVDGHTDKQPISTPQFQSNWELSTARATSVVKFLIKNGLSPEYLAATGFGEYHPIDKSDTPESFKKNRRIEFKLTTQ